MSIAHLSNIKTPYYIYAPSWTYKSSGVKVLHLLCHFLNIHGQKAYLCPDKGEGYSVHPELNTPILKPQYENFYNQSGVDPIAIYPDIVKGNPFNAKKVIRYLLAPAGAYGGDRDFPESNKIYGYRSDITKPTLCIPTFDIGVFYPGNEARLRDCFYAHKYDRIHGNPLVEREATRVEGTPEQIANILRKSRICYVYEMSEIIVLAQLCGCRVEFVKTDYFKGTPEDWDFGGLEYDSPEANKKKLQEWDVRFLLQLSTFVRDTQGEWK